MSNLKEFVYSAGWHVRMYAKFLLFIGPSGPFCDQDYDGCEDNQCTESTSCSDQSVADHARTRKAFICSACPHGYHKETGSEICVGALGNRLNLRPASPVRVACRDNFIIF